jgi:hypothetical protein
VPPCLPAKQKDHLLALFAADEHVQAEAISATCQQMITAYREPGRSRGRALMVKLVESLSHGVPAALEPDWLVRCQLRLPMA